MIRSFWKIASILTALLFVLSCASSHQTDSSPQSKKKEKYLLRLNVKKDQTFVMGQEIEGKGTIQRRKEKKKTDFLQKTIMPHRVVAVEEDGSIWFEYYNLKLYIRYESGDSVFLFDSQRQFDFSHPLSVAMSVITNEPFRFKMSPRSELLEVEDKIELLVRKAKNLSQSTEFDDSAIESFGSRECLWDTMITVTPSYPEEAVGVGDSWTTYHENRLEPPLKTERTCTLKGVKEKEYIVKCTDTALLDPTLQVKKVVLPDYSEYREVRDHTFVIDRDTGLIIEARHDLKTEHVNPIKKGKPGLRKTKEKTTMHEFRMER
jgi:hypothetical protein